MRHRTRRSLSAVSLPPPRVTASAAHVQRKRGRLPARQAHPLHRAELVRDKSLPVARTITDDRHEERLLSGHVMRPFDREVPLVPKVTLEPLLRVRGDNRNEEDAIVDLVPDLLIPRVSASQLGLVEEDLDIACAQCLGNLLGCLSVL